MKNLTILYVLLLCSFLYAQQVQDPFYGKYTLGNSAELVTLWPQKDGTDCHLKIYDFTESKTITGQTDVTYNGAWALGGNKQMDITCGDFNRDGIDEVLLARNIPNGSDRDVVLSVYSYNPATSEFSLQLSDTSIYATGWHLRHIDLACGDFNNDGFDEAAVSFMRWSYRWSTWHDFWGCHDDFYVTDCHMLYSLDVRPDLKGIDLQQDEPQIAWCSEVKLLTRDCGNRTVYYVSPPTALTCADLNNDGRDELLYACAGKVRIYQPGIDPTLQDPFKIKISDRNNDVSRRMITVADLDAGANVGNGWYPEIIVSDWITNNQRRLRVFAPRINNGTLTGIDQIPDDKTEFPDVFSLDGCAALAVGNFDGDGVNLGAPSHFRKTIVQPTTIINAPPLHYDIFDDVSYDITGCYSGNCNFWAQYSQVSSMRTEIQTELRNDWGVSASVGGGFSVMGFAIQAHLTASYGQGFSKTYFASSTITGQSSTTISFDDVIYASVNNYDIWEYPVYADGELIDGERVLVVVPSVEQESDQWYNSKNKGNIGKNFVPVHESGNIFSYHPDKNLSAIDGFGQMIYDDESFNLESSFHDWSVNFENFSGETDLSYYQVAMEVGASISACIHNFSLKETITTANVRFYIGDPDDRGIPIISLDGDSVFNTASILNAREKSLLTFEWKVPEDIPYYPKIYAEIDPSDVIAEIHENNNKGFRILEVEGIVGIKATNDPDFPNCYNLKHNYPNPFNPSTVISYQLPVISEVDLSIYNLLGQKVFTLVSEKQQAGSYRVEWDATDFASGVYYYQIKAGEFQDVKKMILLR